MDDTCQSDNLVLWELDYSFDPKLTYYTCLYFIDKHTGSFPCINVQGITIQDII